MPLSPLINLFLGCIAMCLGCCSPKLPGYIKEQVRCKMGLVCDDDRIPWALWLQDSAPALADVEPL